jgi:hypothetical protein
MTTSRKTTPGQWQIQRRQQDRAVRRADLRPERQLQHLRQLHRDLQPADQHRRRRLGARTCDRRSLRDRDQGRVLRRAPEHLAGVLPHLSGGQRAGRHQRPQPVPAQLHQRLLQGGRGQEPQPGLRAGNSGEVLPGWNLAAATPTTPPNT